MKHTIKLLFGLLMLTNSGFSQSIDTLKVIILTPNKIEISDNYLAEYNIHKAEILEKRKIIKEQKLKDKQEHFDEYNNQPDYSKRMLDNEINFYDSLTIDNYISTIVREYISYRLYRPFKIKPRLVFIETLKLHSNLDDYSKLADGNRNMFIINIPTMKLYKKENKFEVQTKIELYSSLTNEILFNKETIGKTKTEMTDFPMCYDNNWDCAFVNSVYPNLFDILTIIASKNTTKK